MKKTILIAMLTMTSFSAFSAGCKTVFNHKTGTFKLVCSHGPGPCKTIFDYQTGQFKVVCH